jgi:hypothetical protein
MTRAMRRRRCGLKVEKDQSGILALCVEDCGWTERKRAAENHIPTTFPDGREWKGRSLQASGAEVVYE